MTSDLEHRAHPRIELDESSDAGAQVCFGVDEMRHGAMGRPERLSMT
jgi:hypothetical protein